MKFLKLKFILLIIIMIVGIGVFYPQLSSARKIRGANHLAQLSNQEKIGILANRIPGKNVEIKKWEKKWAESQTAIAGPEEGYLTWAKNAKAVVNPANKPFKVFYPGIGPYVDKIDIISPLLTTNYNKLIAIDNGDLNFQEFKTYVTNSLPKKIKNNVKFKNFTGEKYKYGVSFTFNGKKREVIVYYNKNGNTFFPPELENGYDSLFTRWTKNAFNPTKTKENLFTRYKWIEKLNSNTGYLITDGEKPYFDKGSKSKLKSYLMNLPNIKKAKSVVNFWDNFSEIPLDKHILTEVIVEERNAHLFIIKNHR